MARAPALHAGGQGFDSLILHKGTERIIRDIGSRVVEILYCYESQMGTKEFIDIIKE